MNVRDIVVIMLATTVCVVLIACVVISFLRPLPPYTAEAINQTLSVMVGGVVGYAAARNGEDR